MSLCKYESEIKIVPQPQPTVYARVSDLRGLQALRDGMNNPELAAKMAGHVPADKVEELRRYLDGMEADADRLTLSTPVGQLQLVVVEREAPKCVKLAGEGAPLQLYVWIQLLPNGENETKMRVTVGAEVNMFMKGMVAKPLQQAADGLANILAAVR